MAGVQKGDPHRTGSSNRNVIVQCHCCVCISFEFKMTRGPFSEPPHAFLLRKFYERKMEVKWLSFRSLRSSTGDGAIKKNPNYTRHKGSTRLIVFVPLKFEPCHFVLYTMEIPHTDSYRTLLSLWLTFFYGTVIPLDVVHSNYKRGVTRLTV